MDLNTQIAADLKAALIAKDSEKATTLRMLMSAMQNRAINDRKKDVGLSNEEILDVIRQEVRKRRDAVNEYTKANRADLAESEQHEADMLAVYLPPELGDDEVTRFVEESIRAVSATSVADFGKVMKSVVAVIGNRASGDRIAAIVKTLLSTASK